MSNITVVNTTAAESLLDLTVESSFEYWTDTLIGLAFFATALIAGQR